MTYVLGHDGFLRFSTTGTGFFKDFLSKHAVHADCARAVRFAGEMFAYQGVLHVDNGSGTYGPKSDDLPKMQAVLLANFPDLKVQVHPFEDVKELRKSLKLEKE